ncbi:MAG TPA: hypothetical protein VJ997_07210 [Longimicrobiales bacterium]|nr:hypothetical protein [Longimicrobiales bacterium]
MADGPDLSELVRRTIDANTRFYQGWVNLSLEYFRGITEVFGGVQTAVSDASGQTASAGSDAVVLEAVEGATASGAFLVTNDLGRTLKCELVASGFEGGDGDGAPAVVAFDPPSFSLEPGEQRVVRAAVAVDPKLAAGVAYTGTFGIKGMEGFSVPVVLRKQHAVDVSPIDRLDVTDATAAGEAPAKPKPEKAKPAKPAPKKAKPAPKKAATKKTSARAASKASPKKGGSRKK